MKCRRCILCIGGMERWKRERGASLYPREALSMSLLRGSTSTRRCGARMLGNSSWFSFLLWRYDFELNVRYSPDRWDALPEKAQGLPGLFSNTLTFSAGPRVSTHALDVPRDCHSSHFLPSLALACGSLSSRSKLSSISSSPTLSSSRQARRSARSMCKPTFPAILVWALTWVY